MTRADYRLSTLESVAIALAYGGATDGAGDHIPQTVWSSLHERGLVATARDFTGEGTTVATEAGQFALAATLKLEAVS